MTNSLLARWLVLLVLAPSFLVAHEHHHHRHEHHEHRPHVDRHLQELLAQTPQGCGYRDPDVNEIYQLQAEQEERIVQVEEERIALERQQYEQQQGTNLQGCTVSMGGGGGTGWDPGNGGDTGSGGGSGGGGSGGGGGGNWNSLVTIPTYVHNVYSGSGEGFLSDATLKQSIQVANVLLASTGFQLALKSIDRVQNDNWFQASSGSSQELEMQSQLKMGGLNTLNIYFKLAISGSSRFCGYAYLAEDATAVGNGDGVTIDINCVLDRTTVAHEVGTLILVRSESGIASDDSSFV